ncbi:YdcF family protein [Calidifontibacter indicus]|uniref:YdcF family protein n=1 Tax=Calidifontibacter indicus TaxID=419650 RepID=UPI003D75FF3C
MVVLGFKNPQQRANLVNRWRAEIALRTVAAFPNGFLVVSGGPTSGGTRSEASKIAEYLRRRGFDGPVLLEERSASTWENITNVLPLIEDCDGLVFASQPAHALKARVYVRRQRPEWADRLRLGRDYRCLERPVLKVALAVYGHLTLRGISHDELTARNSTLACRRGLPSSSA